tara:strand:+ start:1732 stop:3591 length:1860 start_codon:yes stop_codon:yes gene_type:complete
MIKIIILWLGLFIIAASGHTHANAPVEASATFKQLLDSVRQKSGVQGIAVSIIEGGKEPTFITSGFANIEQRTNITKHTQFRFGSVSKILVAMSVMKLIEQHQLTLNTPLQQLIPEIHFDNPYEADFPLTVHHLLNHTTGWDAMRFAENVPTSASPVTLKQALDVHPDSRQSRWPPGSRFAYNNTGPLVAAYIVEKLSGVSFESFVKSHFLTPLGMTNTDYFYTDHYRQHAATLYLGNTSLAYEHLNNRPAGGLNSDMADMIALVRFLLAQGKEPSKQVLSATSFQTLQTPAGSLSVDAGIELTYAQGVNLFHANGLLLFGHEGSVRGGSALVIYQPDIQKGYVIAVNGEGPAVPQIHQFLANLITQPGATQHVSEQHHFSEKQQALSGFYRSINPGASLIAPFSVLSPWQLKVTNQSATIGPIVGAKPRPLGAGDDNYFTQWQTGKTILLAAEDPIAGAVIHYGPQTFKRISVFTAYAPLSIVLVWVLLTIIAFVFALIWLPRKLLGKTSVHASIRLRSWPLITLLPLMAVITLFFYAKASPAFTSLLGQPSWVSVGITASSVLFLLASLWSMVVCWQTPRRNVNTLIYWHSALLISLNGLIAFYLLLNGLIGVRLWA